MIISGVCELVNTLWASSTRPAAPSRHGHISGSRSWSRRSCAAESRRRPQDRPQREDELEGLLEERPWRRNDNPGHVIHPRPHAFDEGNFAGIVSRRGRRVECRGHRMVLNQTQWRRSSCPAYVERVENKECFNPNPNALRCLVIMESSIVEPACLFLVVGGTLTRDVNLSGSLLSYLEKPAPSTLGEISRRPVLQSCWGS